ncbi:LOW QUALITY PROTEIN: hypothetical protein HID58_040225 [Brassica napus]|uniref:C2H2-type domain-containing protein n=1 Tax=Brassica napus TaxID=3708 RepID=A0ABQ8B7H4_BRANA|nr:LOW QUALITY PROTEIN: hypothetical protein HID58_040225 [Brassica napus]
MEDSVFLSDRTTHQPVRSVSLPTRIHPLSVKLRAALNRLSIWRRSSSSVSVSASFGSETLLVGLANLTELYGCVHELLESSYVRNTLRHHHKGKLLEDSLNGSIVLLDVCEAAREVIVTMREHMMNLKSALRRKGSVEKEVRAYANVRKKAKKEISKHLNGLKKMETIDISPNIDQDPAVASTSVLRETIEISVSILRHLLLFLSTTPPPSPPPARKIKNIIVLNMTIKKQLRSISLPSRSHPSTAGIEEALNKVKAINTTPGSSESILTALAGLEELYNRTEEFLKMGSTQRVMSSDVSEFMEEMLDGSLRLMDICNISRDLMVETHEHVRGVQSCVRRKKVARGGADQLDVAVAGYVRFRKNMRKETKKVLGSLKKFNGESCSSSSGSFLEFLSGRESNIKSKLSSVLKKKKVHHEETKNELEKVEMSIDGFEKYLEGLFRSDPEKTKVNTEERINENSDESDYLWSDEEEEGEMREIVLALPALSLSDVDQVTRQKAVAAADLLIAAAQEAAVTKDNMEQEVGGSGGTVKKKKARRPRTVMLDDLADVAGASGSEATVSAGEEEPAKKPRKKGSPKLINPPEGPPKCNVCGRSFLSWKAVFGHLRAHRDRGYSGFLPPPTFNAAVEASGGDVAASCGGGGFGLGTGGLKIDLNADPIDEEEEECGTTTPKFDLNRSPPQDEEDAKEDKAEQASPALFPGERGFYGFVPRRLMSPRKRSRHGSTEAFRQRSSAVGGGGEIGSHPSTSGVEEALAKVKTIDTTKSSFELISTGLAGLEELYDCTFLKMCSTQRAMSSVRSDFMEEMLDGSLRLMDICSVSRDLMVETQEHVRDLQSCVRRKKVAGGGDQLDVAVSGYVKFRKNMRKETKKLLVSLKSIDGRSSSYDHEDEHHVAVIYRCDETSGFCWCIRVEVVLGVIVGTTKGESCTRDDIQEKLEEVEMSIGGFEKNLEGLFRRLIRTRASLLNIISH